MSDHKTKILIVDDEPQLRELLVDALDGQDLEIATAGSGEEALCLAREYRPDLLVTDICLGDCTGLDIIDKLRADGPEIPAVVITGYGDLKTLSEASRRRPVEVLNKPIDLGRLRSAIQNEIQRQSYVKRQQTRTTRLRKLARKVNRQRKDIHQQLDSTCERLTGAYRELSQQLSLQRQVMEYHNNLLQAKSDDDIFRSLFGLFVNHSGGIFGAAFVCDANAELQLVGRFGVPNPDPQHFCLPLAKPIIDLVLSSPKCTVLDAGDQLDLFDPAIHRYLAGLSILALPLIPSDDQMIGLVLLYRKGEQPFLDGDLAIAEMISRPTAIAVQRNE